jgi:hypothetical protein
MLQWPERLIQILNIHAMPPRLLPQSIKVTFTPYKDLDGGNGKRINRRLIDYRHDYETWLWDMFMALHAAMQEISQSVCGDGWFTHPLSPISLTLARWGCLNQPTSTQMKCLYDDIKCDISKLSTCKDFNWLNSISIIKISINWQLSFSKTACSISFCKEDWRNLIINGDCHKAADWPMFDTCHGDVFVARCHSDVC